MIFYQINECTFDMYDKPILQICITIKELPRVRNTGINSFFYIFVGFPPSEQDFFLYNMYL